MSIAARRVRLYKVSATGGIAPRTRTAPGVLRAHGTSPRSAS
ncbi:hypothetical protein [Streptomyces acidiscabies]|uniref:Uncharacterized protein n=1 Tax=Streptomyces acidiscabies TaxID=42234 RepID=A0ABU4MBX2_9ACTN|nr:hypothetical protein [Streptomyces acidiscabies]MDX3024999.1 hypothetical protein [Streptomyces acidiscabies]